MATFSSTNRPTRKGSKAGSTYDLDALHRFLWGMADQTKGRVTFRSTELAESMLIHERTLRRCIGYLERDGRLRFLEFVGREQTRVFSIKAPS